MKMYDGSYDDGEWTWIKSLSVNRYIIEFIGNYKYMVGRKLRCVFSPDENVLFINDVGFYCDSFKDAKNHLKLMVKADEKLEAYPIHESKKKIRRLKLERLRYESK